MKSLNALYEGQASSKIKKNLEGGAKRLEYVAKNIDNIEKFLIEKFGNKVELDYRYEGNNLYLEINVPKWDKSELTEVARDMSYEFKPLMFKIISDTRFELVYDLF